MGVGWKFLKGVGSVIQGQIYFLFTSFILVTLLYLEYLNFTEYHFNLWYVLNKFNQNRFNKNLR